MEGMLANRGKIELRPLFPTIIGNEIPEADTAVSL
jgi:hypothetical protein